MLDRAIVDTLRQYMLDDRFDTLEAAAVDRMRGVTVVLESLYDPGNQAAVFRTADAHGLMDVHVIKPENATKTNARAVSRGAEKWLDIHTYKESSHCIDRLKADGFQIAVSDLEAASPLEALDFSRPTAIVFGSERFGVSDEMREAADIRFKIPMHGFVQSFNISVAAAITLHTARRRRERALGAMTDMSVDERLAVLARWMRRSVAHSDRLLLEAGIQAPPLPKIMAWDERRDKARRKIRDEDELPAIGIPRSEMRGRRD